MSLIARCSSRLSRSHSSWQPQNTNLVSPRAPGAFRRWFYDGGQNLAVEEAVASEELRIAGFWEEYKASFRVPKPTPQSEELWSNRIPISHVGQRITATGYIGPKRVIGNRLIFAPLSRDGSKQIQILARSEINPETVAALRKTSSNSVVCVTGVLALKHEDKKKSGVVEHDSTDRSSGSHDGYLLNQMEIRAESIQCLNAFPKELRAIPRSAPSSYSSQYGFEKRHLQIRFDLDLKKRLEMRSRIAQFARKQLSDFQEIETPLLFKSTPEGAREFVVPTRTRGLAYGLPQSPQQYKQVLMAGGISKYMQFAKCFRDEDYRADRQPEFTQIDLEMAWATGEDVIQRVESFIYSVWKHFAGSHATAIPEPPKSSSIPRITYAEAMDKYGSDKPDLRLEGMIHRVDHIVPEQLCKMLTSLESPIVEAWKVSLGGDSKETLEFISTFLDSPDGAEFRNNPDGAPGVFVFDSTKPLEGLQAFGFEQAENLKNLYASVNPEATKEDDPNNDMSFTDGDLLLIQARENVPHTGGSTVLGKLRLAVHKAALARNLIAGDPKHHFLWVTDFPLFTANTGQDPGQGGLSGFSSTHHPFTAPKTAEDVDMLLTEPLKVIADHYDLVVNGVELGGGSRRIHSAEMQKFIMRDILKMHEKSIDNFSHLFEALRSACPPHAGFAIGFDRLVAVMLGRGSVRDVIAFPKDSRGHDLMAKAPSRISEQTAKRYFLRAPRDSVKSHESEQKSESVKNEEQQP